MVLKRITLLTLLWCTTLLLPQALSASTELTVAPQICVKKRSESQCTLVSEIDFAQQNPVPVCFNAQHIDHRRCFASREHINYTLEFNASSSFLLQVLNSQSETPLAEQMIRVLRYDPESTKVRRRFGWGF